MSVPAQRGRALDALTSLDLRSEVHAALSYLLSCVAKTAPDLRVFYAMNGQVAAAEIDKVELWTGYRDSSPVQVGNNAASQRQLGAYGGLLEAITRYARHRNVLDGSTGQLVATIAERVTHQWTEHDAGLWELGTYRPYTSSKIGCWAALSRPVQLAEMGQVPADQAPRWRQSAEEIRAYINDARFSSTKGSYTFYAGTTDLNCATLLAARTASPPATTTGCMAPSTRSAPSSVPAIARRLDEGRQLMDEMVEFANDLGPAYPLECSDACGA